MPVVLLVAAVVILIGVVLASLGRAGEMADFPSDTPPMELDEVSATDVALLRPPMSLWGYNAQATEDALRVIARSVTERDVEIATLRRELAELRGDPDGARAAGIGGPRVSPAGRPGLPGGAGQAYRPGPAGQEGPPAGDIDHASTITSVPGGQAQRASAPGAAATQPGGQVQRASAQAPGGQTQQASAPAPGGQAQRASAPGAATQPSGQAQAASAPAPGGQAHGAGLPGASGETDPPGQAGVPGPADPPGQAEELPFWAWQHERGADD